MPGNDCKTENLLTNPQRKVPVAVLIAPDVVFLKSMRGKKRLLFRRGLQNKCFGYSARNRNIKAKLYLLAESLLNCRQLSPKVKSKRFTEYAAVLLQLLI